MRELNPWVVIGFALMFGFSAGICKEIYYKWLAKKEFDAVEKRRK